MLNLLFIPAAAGVVMTAFAIYDNGKNPWGNTSLIFTGVNSVIWTIAVWVCFHNYSPLADSISLAIAEITTAGILPLGMWVIRGAVPARKMIRAGVPLASGLYVVFLALTLSGFVLGAEQGADGVIIFMRRGLPLYACIAFNALCPLYLAACLVDWYAGAPYRFRRDLRNLLVMIPVLAGAVFLLCLRFFVPASRIFGCFYQAFAVLLFYFLLRRIHSRTLTQSQAAHIVFTSVQTPFLFLDIFGDILYANDFAIRYFGNDLEEFRTKNLGDLFVFEKDPPRFPMKKAESTADGEYSAVTVDGGAPCQLSVRCLWDSYSELQGVVVEINDISAEKKLIARLEQEKKRAEAAAEAKSNFLASTSHEIRTPINAILGMAELILREKTTPEIFENADGIRQAGENLLAIINDILDFSKIESGKPDITPAPYSLSSVIGDCMKIVRTRLDESPLLFIVNVDAKLPDILRGDGVRIRQIMLNLLGNAVKFTPSGAISLFVSGEKTEISGEKPENGQIVLVIRVSDTGIGIKKEDMDLVFEEFGRAGSHLVHSTEGTGLGLAISRRLCRLMGGDISASSRFGEGSIFTATIPQEVLDGAPLARLDEAAPVLLHEPRTLYAASIESSLRGLGAPFQSAPDWDAFLRELGRGTWKWALVTAEKAEAAENMAREGGLATVIVCLAAPGFPSPRHIPVLAMPVWAAPLAGLFNGSAPVFSRENEGPRFAAPGASMLIVDDIETNLRVVSRLFSPWQIGIDTCLSGKKALEMIAQKHYDIVLMDHMMPEMDGIETTAKIREYEKSAALPPGVIIAFTANAVTGMREMFLDAGFDDFLPKPVEPSKIGPFLERWIPEAKKIISRPAPETENSVTGGGATGSGGDTSGDGTGETAPGDFSVEGIDVAEGIALCGGSPDYYRSVLEIFMDDSRARLEFFRQFRKATEGQRGEMLKDLVVYAHALKGASGMIGGRAISSAARDLETAGRAGNIESVNALVGDFSEQLEALVFRIGQALETVSGGKNGDGTDYDEERRMLKDSFAELIAALETEDLRGVNRILDSLGRAARSAPLVRALSGISEQVLICEYGAAATLAREIIS